MLMSKKKREKILNYSIISLKLFWIWETKYEHYESDVDLTVTEQEMLDTMLFRIYRTQKGFNHVKVINNDITINPLDRALLFNLKLKINIQITFLIV